MKTSSIALRAIVLSLFLLLNSGFLAMAADSTAVPEKPVSPLDDSELHDDEKGDLTTVPANAASSAGERPDDDQIPVGVKINGIMRDEGMEVYFPEGYSEQDTLVPLGKLSELLSFAITSNAGDKKAEGFFFNEENTFQLDLNTNEVLIKGQKKPLKPNEVEIQQDEIYVKASSIEEWFDIKIGLDTSNLVLEITTDVALPFQEQQKRLANAKKSRTFKFEPVKPENAELSPYKQFSLPSLYVTNSIGARRASDGSSGLNGQATVQGNQDFLGFETNYTFGGLVDSQTDLRRITGARFTMQKRDINRNLLGPLNAGMVAFGDVSFPSVPLLIGGQRGAGVQMSSEPRLGSRYANNTENFILDGDAPVGYDAELYRNGIFIAFQKIGADGRYSFENVDLTTGYNNFEVILYGPQGQKTVIKRDVVRGSRLLRKNETQYDFAAGTPKGDLLPFAYNNRDDKTLGMSGQIFHGITEFFTMGASVYSGPETDTVVPENNFISTSIAEDIDNKDNTTRGTGGAISTVASFLGMNVQGQVLAADKGRSAYGADISARPFGVNVGLGHTEYKNFLAENQEIKSRTQASLFKNFGKFSSRLQLEQREYVDRESERIYEHTLSFRLLGLTLNNDLVKTVSEKGNYDNFEGEFAAAAKFYGIRFRSSLVYNLDDDERSRFSRFSFSGQKYLGNSVSVTAQGVHDFDAKNDALNVRVSKDYDKFGLDFNTTATTDNDYTFTVGMRMALQPDQNDEYHFVDPKTGGQAALGARAFLDNNNNGVYDAGTDKLLENIGFRASTSGNSVKTGQDGIAYVTNLGEAPLRLSVQTDTLEDIYLAPKFGHRDLIPRRGSTPIIDFPFVKMSEISGYLLHLKQGVEGIIVRLINGGDGQEVETTETDSDGYFIFPAVKGGNYKIAFGLPDHDFMSLNVDLDATIEDPEEMKIEVSDELAKAAEEAAAVKTSAGSPAAERNRERMNAPAGEMPNIDDPLNEEDLKPLDEKGVENIITQ